MLARCGKTEQPRQGKKSRKDGKPVGEFQPAHTQKELLSCCCGDAGEGLRFLEAAVWEAASAGPSVFVEKVIDSES